MRSIVVMALLLAPAALQSRLAAAQDPSGPRPVQPARPLELPALQPPIADTGIFSPAPLPAAVRVPASRWIARTCVLAAARRLRHQGHARHHREADQRSVPLQYTNNSPDTLRYVWMQLDQNLFRPGSTGSLLFASDSRFGGAGFKGGFEIDQGGAVFHAGTAAGSDAGPGVRPPTAQRAAFDCLRATGASPLRLRTRVEDTMMYMDLVRPIPPGGTTILALTYAFNVPEHGADRMGRDGSLYQIAQWYPRMAVYDDVHGWNTDQYLGQGEFYLEYGNIDYEITLPSGYIVAGTGLLLNPEQVLTASQRERLAVAAKSDSTRSHPDRARASLRRRASRGCRPHSRGASGLRTYATPPGLPRLNTCGTPPAGRVSWCTHTTGLRPWRRGRTRLA